MLMVTSQILKSVGFTKTKISISQERNIFSSNQKIHLLHMKCYFMTKNSFVAEVTFKCLTLLLCLLSDSWIDVFHFNL